MGVERISEILLNNYTFVKSVYFFVDVSNRSKNGIFVWF